MNIILTGYRGSGKTKIGRLIAEKLNLNFYDLDAIIEEKEGAKITKIIEEKGWDYFRNLEHTSCQELAKAENSVVSTGGGTLTFERNQGLIKGTTIYLKAPTEVLASRIKDSKKRPALTNQNFVKEIEAVLKERDPIYTKVADIIFDNSSPAPPESKAIQIIQLLNEKL